MGNCEFSAIEIYLNLRRGHIAAGWLASIYDAAMMGAIGVVFYIYAPWLLSFFGRDPAVDSRFFWMYSLGIEYLRITIVAYSFAGIAVTLAHALTGAGATKVPLVLDSIAFAIQIPIAAFVCLYHEEYGYTRETLWWSIVLTMVLVAAFYAFIWNRRRWMDQKIQ